MTSVNITQISNLVEVTENGATAVVQVPATTVVTATTVGPQGPQGPPGSSGLLVDDSAKVDKSIVYYDAAAATFKADSTWTTDTIVDGANF